MSQLQYLATVKQTKLLTETRDFWRLGSDIRFNRKTPEAMEAQLNFYISKTGSPKVQQRLLTLRAENRKRMSK